MKVELKKWEPVEIKPEMYKACYAELHDTYEGVTISLKFNDTAKSLNVEFEDSVLAYQSIDEGDRLKLLDYLAENYEDEFYGEWTLFKVNNSEYLNWFNNENHGIYEEEKIDHYVFLTSSDVVDVLSVYEPKVSIQN